MKQSVFFLLLTFLFACGSATGPKYDTQGYETESIGGGAEFATFKDANGWYLAKGTLRNGVRNGSWLGFHENSNKIKTLTSYMNGVKNGIQINFNDRGQIESVSEFKNDELHGLKATYKFGRPTEETNYNNGKMDGQFALYDGQGKLQRKGTLKNGEYHGKLQYFDEGGRVIMEYEYENGKKISGGIIENETPSQ
jgi:antitoxin component YwqK of YwqJK toxin-antitoxin module